uniref:Reverse transcriptase domain-containing protein n=1 Tax=Tanacetum cinerariifolium TaxID=118510 RepID=A0A6L2J834_TANCI|nr:hypothetical protein [Tanacetum cinerariifolium]
MDQNINFSGSDQIQTPEYPEIHPPSQEISDEVFHAKGDLMKSIQTFLEEFNYIPFEEKPKILLQAWDKFFAIQHAQLEDSNELFQKLLEDLKELTEYNRPIFFDHNEDHSVQNKKNSSNEIATSNSNQEKENHYKTPIFEVKNVIEQPTERKTHIIESLQNFRVIRKSSTSLKDTSQISPIHAIASILSTKEPKYSPSIGYEHPNTTPKIESDEIIKSDVEELVPIQSECEVTSEDKSKCDMPIQDQSSSVFTTFSNPLFKDNDDLNSRDDESLFEEDVPIEESKVYSNPLFDNDEINSDELESHVESNFVESLSNHDALIESSQKINCLKEFSDELAHINPEITESDFDFEEEIRFIENLLYDNSSPRLLEELNVEIANTIIQSIPPSLIPIQDNDSQREEIDIATNTDELLPLGFENDDSEGGIDAGEELHVDNSISNAENELSDNEDFDFDNPSFPRPPPKPPDVEFDFELDVEKEISVVMNSIVEFECLYPRDEFDVSNDENDDYSSFVFVICSKMFLFFPHRGRIPSLTLAF